MSVRDGGVFSTPPVPPIPDYRTCIPHNMSRDFYIRTLWTHLKKALPSVNAHTLCPLLVLLPMGGGVAVPDPLRSRYFLFSQAQVIITCLGIY